jgi:hypothetical protein
VSAVTLEHLRSCYACRSAIDPQRVLRRYDLDEIIEENERANCTMESNVEWVQRVWRESLKMYELSRGVEMDGAADEPNSDTE